VPGNLTDLHPTPGLWYISAQGTQAGSLVAAGGMEIGYTLRATWWPKPQVQSLWTTQVEDNVVGAGQYRHYVIELDNAAVTTRMNNLVLKLVTQEFQALYTSRALTLFVQRDQLALSRCSDFECTANMAGYTYCTIKVPFCQLYNGTKRVWRDGDRGVLQQCDALHTRGSA
jgi:hypothetical protein